GHGRQRRPGRQRRDRRERRDGGVGRGGGGGGGPGGGGGNARGARGARGGRRRNSRRRRRVAVGWRPDGRDTFAAWSDRHHGVDARLGGDLRQRRRVVRDIQPEPDGDVRSARLSGRRSEPARRHHRRKPRGAADDVQD